ncbi:UDP-3-O-(3-hydroxymyristoyl)glucosamine N-acyltransferase [Rhodopirellula sp. MGV]|uniref:UDP-3-O-(3-hydroxymyristoyl)glucosamine N-acyltransferase n=1 Tax=Rhodopirellula sp. MGV TaxID=2023130 RepID=UPI000B972006|nr:UDP-3-O-(3-hydroxymyristoyl)glucosamine N-acyltransferase [Rhodopirellula sp. MGV]OYP28507.1 UDP-3-O-(3-hydroxymyristoyl)glucosamine N-acyltransferase [Rhodopirellula sp. MGV]PNY38919.1 UDP-3-O-(3-hydroxymyristoyl)glucosamine N-acyltransferase [Rhodopirellula baltica]
MAIRLDELSQLVEGTLHGDGALICQGANPLDLATEAEITLVVQPVGEIGPITALAVVTKARLENCDRPQIIVDQPHAAFARIVAHFRPPITTNLPGVGVDSNAKIASSAKVHPTATICRDVVVGERTLIMPGVVVMPGCRIGNDCVLHPHVTLYSHTQIGDRVVIHASSTIGADGFGYRFENGRHMPASQLGYVEIESDVDVGAGVTIDRGTYGATRIGQGTKIDNQVMIAHNCQIGRHNLICSQVGIAGSCSTGDHVILAGQVGLKDHIKLGDGTIVGAKAGVMDDCEGGQVYLGAPAMPQRDQMQIFALQRKLPDMRRELKSLKKQLAELTAQLRELTDGSDADDHASSRVVNERAA